MFVVKLACRIRSQTSYALQSSNGTVDQDGAMVRPLLQRLYVDHIVFRVRDFGATRDFYHTLLGDPVSQTESSLMYLVGETRLFFTLSVDGGGPYDKELPGLNHLAFGVHTPTELKGIVHHLNSKGVQHSGIKVDHYGNKEFVWLDDPNGFRLEFYCRPKGPAA
jgi:catechol-2,3-dioxygenase